MKLASVEIRNFRAVEEMTLPLHPQLTVLHGENGLGKTSVLRAIAVGLGAIPRLLPGVSGIDFARNDLRHGSKGMYVTLHARDRGSWSRKRESVYGSLLRVDAGPHLPGLGWLNERMGRIVAADRNGGRPEILPIVTYYDTERTVLDVPQRRRGFPKEFHRRDALQGALSARASFRQLFQWFYAIENEELREQRDRHDFEFRHRGLTAVRYAIGGVLRDVSEPRIRTRPLRFEVTLESDRGGERLRIDQLSGGYKAVLALAADLAWRMAQGNPHLENPLASEAVVLIDEVDLHLHPSWQQRILDDLTRTFPNAQFIVTTHSPQVLTTVRPEQVVTLVREDGKIVPRGPGWGTYGAEAGDVLTVVMGVEERPRNEFSETLEQYRELIEHDRGESEEALDLRKKLDAWNRRDPDLVRADAAIRRRKTLRRMGRTG